MCAFASRSFNVERGRPLGQWDLLGDELSLDILLWLEPSFPPCAPSLSLSFSFTPSFSFARPLCSARRMSKCFLRPGTARRWVKEWVCSKWKKKNKTIILFFYSSDRLEILGYFQRDFVNENIDLWRTDCTTNTLHWDWMLHWERLKTRLFGFMIVSITSHCMCLRHTTQTRVNITCAYIPFQVLWKVTSHQTFGFPIDIYQTSQRGCFRLPGLRLERKILPALIQREQRRSVHL